MNTAIQTAITEGKLEEALDLAMQDNSLTDARKNSVLLLKSRLASLNEEKLSGVIDAQDYRLEKNRLSKSFLATFDPNYSSVENPAGFVQQYKTAIIGAVVILVLLVIFLMTRSSTTITGIDGNNNDNNQIEIGNE